MSKRDASHISANCRDSDSCHSTEMPISSFSIEPCNNNPSHFIVPTILGPICTRCNVKISPCSTLFFVTRKMIKTHWAKNRCYEGSIALLNATELERSLTMSTINVYNSMRHKPLVAAKIVNDQFSPTQKTHHSPYCTRCGYVGKLCNVKRHGRSLHTSCSESNLNLSGGVILYNNYDFAVPRQILNAISAGSFILPIPERINTTIEINHATDDGMSAISSPTLSQSSHQYNETHPSTPSRFVPSNDELLAICSPDSLFDDSSTIDSFAMSELVDTFGDEVSAVKAREYLTSFIHLLHRKCPGKLRSTLSSYAKMSNTVTNDPNLRLFLSAGKKWLISNSANMDVRMVPVHHRNLIYLVGHSYTDADKDLHKGCTFSWVDKCKDYIPIFQSLVTFVYMFHLPFIQPFLNNISYVYDRILENGNVTNNLEEMEELALSKIVDSTIIYGFLAAIIYDEPSKPNGPNIMYHLLASKLVKVTNGGRISLRHPNEISKHANGILRILRYGLCSYYVRNSFLMTTHDKSNKEFQAWATDLITGMQCCPSVGHICRTIRTAREVDSKTPSSVLKSFNDVTGELLVAGTTIDKCVWSTAIPSALTEWDQYLMHLFPNHSSSSHLPLELIFNLNNSIVLADSDSTLSIHNDNGSSILLTEFVPTFP